jgi:hypothetical protein
MQAPSKPPDELCERVEKLEAEVAALKEMLKRLKAEVTGDAKKLPDQPPISSDAAFPNDVKQCLLDPRIRGDDSRH